MKAISQIGSYKFFQEAPADGDASGGVSGDAGASDSDSTVLTGEQGNTESQDDNNADDGAKSSEDDSNSDSEDGDADNADDKSDDDEGENKDSEGYDFQVPEGMELDEALSEKFSGLAKELGLDNEQANKVASMYFEQIQSFQDAYAQNWTNTVEGWANDLKADPDFGGANFEANAEIAKAAVNKFGSDEFKQALNETGLGNHPEMVKFMLNIGKAISEDSFGEVGHTNTAKESSPQGLYSKSNMNP